MPRRLTVDDFWARANRKGPEECWVWTGPTTDKGYGKFKNTTAYRYSYELLVGPVPDRLHVLHRCDNPPCVNPAHLFVGTHQDNMRDKIAKGRGAKVWGRALNRKLQTHCKWGHRFSPENTGRNGRGHRYCRQCQSEKPWQFRFLQDATEPHGTPVHH